MFKTISPLCTWFSSFHSKVPRRLRRFDAWLRQAIEQRAHEKDPSITTFKICESDEQVFHEYLSHPLKELLEKDFSSRSIKVEVAIIQPGFFDTEFWFEGTLALFINQESCPQPV